MKCRSTWYETFDWRLDQAGLRLEVEHQGAGTLVLRKTDGEQLFRGRKQSSLGFAVDLPEGPLRETLAPVLAMRRLLPLVVVDLQSQEICVLNSEAKTVARLVLQQGTAMAAGSASTQPLAETLAVHSVRGYDGEFQRLIQNFEQEMKLARCEDDALVCAVHAIGRQLGDYSSKVQVELDPAAPILSSARWIHLSLLSAIRRNEEGARQDLDSEFLHDFRVAVRRTRSALSQIRGVFPEAVLAYFKGEFGWLGSLTGPTRDLDVYLLKLGDYYAALPTAIHHDLEPLARLLRREQRREQRKLAKTLGGARYRGLLSVWQQFLEEGKFPDVVEAVAGWEQTAAAQRPTAEVAAERIWKIYRRVLRRGAAIRGETAAEEVHRLRLDCKKLRYLVEFFKGIYPSVEVGRLVSVLKRLQDNLGDFNDYEVQQEHLADFAERLFAVGEAEAATLLAMGRLQAHLAEGQMVARRKLGKVFAQFACRQHREEFRALFQPA